MNNVKIYHERIDISEDVNVNKANESKESIICHFWYFLDKGFIFGVFPSKKIILFGWMEAFSKKSLYLINDINH